MRYLLLLVLLVALPARAQDDGNPCEDERYQRLQEVELDKMTERQFAYFTRLDEACRQHQAQGMGRVAMKDPAMATLLSVLITGGGHMYAGEVTTGVVLLLGSAGVITVGYAASRSSTSAYCGSGTCTDETNYGPLAVGAAGAFGLWLYSVMDAGSAAERANRRHGLTVAPVIGERKGLTLAYRF